MYYFYVLRADSINPLFYLGATCDLQKRLALHNAGAVFSTKGHHWKVVYYEAFEHKANAFARERRLKTHGKAWQELKKRIGA